MILKQEILSDLAFTCHTAVVPFDASIFKPLISEVKIWNNADCDCSKFKLLCCLFLVHNFDILYMDLMRNTVDFSTGIQLVIY